MEYTTQIIANPNDSNTGFWLVFFICSLIFCLVFIATEDDDEYTRNIVRAFFFLIGSAVCLYVGYESRKELPVPLNQPTEAYMVGHFESNERTSGKYPKDYIAQNVVYRTPDGDISFKRKDGVVYAPKVILYKQR